jgi:hypothetical protein
MWMTSRTDMKTFLRLLFLALALLVYLRTADAQTTAVNDTLYLQGTAWTGEITVCWPSFTSAGGTAVAKGCRTSAVTNGVVSISLYPTEGASPSFAYAAGYRQTSGAGRGTAWSESWAVPSSPSIVTLADVRQSSSYQIFPSQISAVGLTDGVYCIQVLSGIVSLTSNCPSGSGGGGGALFDTYGDFDSSPGLFDSH